MEKHDRHQAQHTAHGEINAPGDDDDRHAAGENAAHRSLPQHVPMGTPLEERPVAAKGHSKREDKTQGKQRADRWPAKTTDGMTHALSHVSQTASREIVPGSGRRRW